MAALFLWKRINKFWGPLSAHHELVKSTLLECLQNEPVFRVRKAICCVVAAIAKHLLPTNQWPQLLQFLIGASQAPSTEHREMSMLLFQAITETVAEYLSELFGDIVRIFGQGLVDPEMKVRLMALKAAGSLVEYKLTSGDGEVLVFKDILRPMIAVVKQALADHDEDASVAAFEVFDELAKSPSNVINHCCSELLQLLLEVGKLF